MKLIVGLGNPGAEYEKTRHNAGFLALDILARRHAPGVPARSRFNAATVETDLPGAGKTMLMKPLTYMNRSGQSVGDAARFYKLDPSADVFVIVDDVALPCGSIRVRALGGAGGHNGLLDIERALGGQNYARCRVGIDAPGRIVQRDYVLGRFSPDQWEAVGPALEAAADASEVWAREGVNSAMNKFNVKRADDREGDNAPTDTQRTHPEDTE